MEPYYFSGVVHPQRALLTLPHFGFRLSYEYSSTEIVVNVNIINNSVHAEVYAPGDVGVYDLRNIVNHAVQVQLSAVGYIKGLYYRLEIARVTRRDPRVDIVFGVDVPCISEGRSAVDAVKVLGDIRQHLVGERGVLLARCFGDLRHALEDADDCAFYCYRSIEALVTDCAHERGISDTKDKRRWIEFRNVSSTDRSEIDVIKNLADPLRHGGVMGITDQQRAAVLSSTWAIVERYLEAAFGIVSRP